MDGEAARKRRERILGTELHEAGALVHQTIGNAQDGEYDTALFSAAFEAIENLKDELEATYHPDRGRLRHEMYSVWLLLSELNGCAEIRKSIEVFSFLILPTCTPLVLTAILLECKAGPGSFGGCHYRWRSDQEGKRIKI